MAVVGCEGYMLSWVLVAYDLAQWLYCEWLENGEIEIV